MLDKFITSLSSEQKQQLIEALQQDLSETIAATTKEPSRATKATPESARTRDSKLDFSVARNKENDNVPINKMKRVNMFVDDGTESKGEEFKTPEVERAERRRPAIKKVEQKCRNCEKTFKVHPAHARDRFICDKCIGVR